MKAKRGPVRTLRAPGVSLATEKQMAALREKSRARAVTLANGRRCTRCKRALQLEPVKPFPLGAKAWDSVAIRCCYCLKAFCRRCARKHFKPAHIVSAAANVRVVKRQAFVAIADETPVAVSLDRATLLRGYLADRGATFQRRLVEGLGKKGKR